MLWNASAFTGYPIKAADGAIGTVSDLMYRDSDWTIRWLIVDTGDWLSGRLVLLPISALGEPDPEAHHLPVNLTMQQIERSPDFDSGLTLSHTHDREASAHYDLSPNLDQAPWGRQDASSARSAANVTERPRTLAGGAAETPAREGRVRCISEITGDAIEATDGDIGHAQDFLIDAALWQVRYLIVHMSDWWAGEKLLVSPLSIDWVDWARDTIHLDVSRQKVKDSPPYIEAETVDGAFEDLFHHYYGFRGPRR